jgi:hypothetical protein
MLNRAMKTSAEYFSFLISFEGMGSASFASEEFFIKECILMLKDACKRVHKEDWVSFFDSGDFPQSFAQFGRWIGLLVEKIGKKVVLMIDEVDKSSNNQLFLDFLGLLRNKYLKRDEEGEFIFHSVILVGVHDVKILKSHIRPDSEKKLNSPWNIATDFDVDISFSSVEIQSMLNDYVSERQVRMDIPSMAEKLFYFTSGYPFLVSLLCKIMDEKVMPEKREKEEKEWSEQDLEKAVQIALRKDNTNFDSLIKNLENNIELYDFVFKLVFGDMGFGFNTDNPVIKLGVLYGVLKGENGRAKVHNRLYEQRIYNYLASKLETSASDMGNGVTSSYLDETGKKIFAAWV